MALKKVTHGWDMTLNTIANVLLQIIAGSPGVATEGQFWYDSTTKRFMYRSDTADIDVRSRAVHSGTQLAATISDFMATVVTARLDQMAPPTAAVSFNGQKATNLADGTNAADAATWGQVQSLLNGLDWGHPSVRLATFAALPAYTRVGNVLTANANGAIPNIDGVAPALNDRILVQHGAAGADNGYYVVTSLGSGAAPWVLTRAADADTSAEVSPGMAVTVEEGTNWADHVLILTTNAPIVLNTTALTFSDLPAPTSLLGGAGLVRTGNTFDVVAAALGGIIVNADSIQVDPAVVVRKYATDIGDGATTSIVVTHNLNTLDVQVVVYDKTTPFAELDIDPRHTTVNTVTIVFAVAPTAAQYRCVVFG